MLQSEEQVSQAVTTDAGVQIATKTVASVLRGLAIDVELSPALASRVIAALVSSGILSEGNAPGPDDSLLGLQVAQIDLLTLYRAHGPDATRARLSVLDYAALRRLIQVQELDPAKKTQRLRSPTKLIDFIMETVGTQVEQERELARTNSWML
jgi:hypothetical protein